MIGFEKTGPWGLSYYDGQQFQLNPGVSIDEARRRYDALSPEYIPRTVSYIARVTSKNDADQVSDLTAIRRYEKYENTANKQQSVIPNVPHQNQAFIQAFGAAEIVYLPKTFGAYLTRIREKAGLSQTSATRLLHLSNSSLARYESGGHLPTISTVRKLVALADRAGVPYGDIKREYIRAKYKPEFGTLGDIIKRERWFAQMTIDQLSKKSGLSATLIRRLEYDHLSVSLQLFVTLSRLARALDSSRLVAISNNLCTEGEVKADRSDSL